MGFRYRKSKNLGKGFRVNMSKSGPGFSWGTKGFRLTRTAKGNIRGTVSLPGTGLSYQKDFGNPTKKVKAKRANEKVNKNTDTTSFNNDLSNIESNEVADINSAANRIKLFNIIGFVFILLGLVLFFVNKYLIFISFFGLGILFYNKSNDKIRIDYDMSDEAREELETTNHFLAGIMESDAVWLVTETAAVDPDSGADMKIVNRKPLTPKKGNDEIETNTETYSLIDGSNKIIFLPDAIFIKEKGNLKGLGLTELEVKLEKAVFLEDGRIPSDATVLGKTYEHVKKDGTPDKRYKDNPELSLVEYGILSLYNQSGLNLLIVFSDTILDGN